MQLSVAICEDRDESTVAMVVERLLQGGLPNFVTNSALKSRECHKSVLESPHRSYPMTSDTRPFGRPKNVLNGWICDLLALHSNCTSAANLDAIGKIILRQCIEAQLLSSSSNLFLFWLDLLQPAESRSPPISLTSGAPALHWQAQV